MKIVYCSIIIFSVMAALCACNLGPEFSRAELQRKMSQEKKTWQDTSDTGKSSAPVRTDWWKQFQDPLLDQLIHEALSNNIDLKIRLARLQESGLSLKENKAGSLPRISSSANASFFRREYVQEAPDILQNQSQVEEKKEESVTSDSEYYNTGLSVSWEMDLWGKKKKNYLATKASYEESKAQYRAECLRVISEIAGTYFDIRKKDREKHILQQLHEENMERISIYENQHREGLVPEWKVLRQKNEADDMQRELKDLEQSRRRQENKMAILLGKPPGEFAIPDTKDTNPPERIQVPPGLPSDLLAARPDIIAAEYRVEKAYHRIGEAQANRLPSISLSGQGGFASGSLSTLLRQWTLGFTPDINFPVFDGGASNTG
ncbi:MAG: efflux transporter outer membrane subunit [Desulfobacterales bacterium]